MNNELISNIKNNCKEDYNFFQFNKFKDIFYEVGKANPTNNYISNADLIINNGNVHEQTIKNYDILKTESELKVLNPFESFSKKHTKTLVISIKKDIKSFNIDHYLGENTANKTIINRLEINIASGQSVNIEESLKSISESLYIQNLIINVDNNSTVNYLKTVSSENKANIICNLTANVKNNSSFNMVTISNNTIFLRNNITVNLNKENASTNLSGIYLPKENHFIDNFVTVNHNSKYSFSNLIFKGIIAEDARAAFTGKVIVKRNSSKVDSNQLNKTILLGRRSKIDSRPELEVYNDDVKCAHGATVGQLSEEEIFYLNSRGIKKERALTMLAESFLAEVTDLIVNKNSRITLVNDLFLNFKI